MRTGYRRPGQPATGPTTGATSPVVEADTSPASTGPAPAEVGPTGRSPQQHGYEHLVALFAEHAALPDGHPRRERLRSALISGYLPVARNIARKYGYRGENPDDLEQVATVGLVLAVDRFDPTRGIDFLSFAVPTITGEVLRHFRDRTAAVRVPRRLRRAASAPRLAAWSGMERHGAACGALRSCSKCR